MKFSLFPSFVAAAAAVVLAAAPVSAQTANSFGTTMRYLDRNGLVLSYLDTGETFDAGRKIASAVTSLAARNKKAALFADIAASVWAQSGIEAVRGFGSSAGKDGPFYVVRQFAYAPEQLRGSGFLWQLLPSSPGLSMLEIVPTTCKLALVSNFEAGVLWNALYKNFNAYAPESGKEQLAELLAGAQGAGFDVPQFVSSISGVGFFMNGPMSFTLALKVKSPAAFDMLSAAVKKNSPEDLNGDEIRFPAGPVSITVFRHGNYIIVSTDADTVKACIAGKMADLGTDPVFKQCSAGLTVSSVSWSYVAPGFCSQIVSFLGVLPMVQEVIPDSSSFMRIVAAAELDQPFFGVYDIQRDGCLTIMRTGSRPFALYMASPEIKTAAMSFLPLAGAVLLNMDDDDDDDAADDDDDDDGGDDDGGNVKKEVKGKEQVRSTKGK